MVTRALVKCDGLGLVISGFQTNDAVTAARGLFFKGCQDSPAEAAAPVTVAHVHAFHLDNPFFLHGPERAASDRDDVKASHQKHAAGFAKVPDVDAVDFQTGITRVEIAIERGYKVRSLWRGRIDFSQYHGTFSLKSEFPSFPGGRDGTIRHRNVALLPQVWSHPKRT